jgi:hypothetical protein
VPTASKKKKVKLHQINLLRMDVSIVAQHLMTLEWRLYVRVKPQECLNWAKSQSSSPMLVSNLGASCEMHEKVASWVKLSVLGNDGLGKRADTVDFWIQVAEASALFVYRRAKLMPSPEMPHFPELLIHERHRRRTFECGSLSLAPHVGTRQSHVAP